MSEQVTQCFHITQVVPQVLSFEDYPSRIVTQVTRIRIDSGTHSPLTSEQAHSMIVTSRPQFVRVKR